MSTIGKNLNSEKAQPWQVTQITGDLRKFSEYLPVPNHKSGKDRIFLGLLGYRPNGVDGAQALLETYLTQARTKFAARDHTIGERDRYEQRFTITIEIREKKLLAGWLLDNQSTLKLDTPFSGFANGGNPL